MQNLLHLYKRRGSISFRPHLVLEGGQAKDRYKMIFDKITLLAVICGVAYGSGIHELQLAPGEPAPVVTAASSQYFQRTFNRLVAAPVFEQVPVAPILPPPQVIPVGPPTVLPVQPTAPVIPVASQPPVIVEATRTTVLPPPTNPPENAASDPNIALAIATTHAAAPVATILLPPYPFGLPPGFNFIPQPTDSFPTDNPNKEPTTQATTKKSKTTQNATTTVAPSNIDDSFIQALPSNENPNVFRQYLAPQVPQQLPQTPAQKPQKLKANFEIVPVPLTYIAPPPLTLHHHHHKHHHHHSLPLKVVPHVHTFIPKSSKIIIIRPLSAPLRVRTVKIPQYKAPQKARNVPRRISQMGNNRDIEPTTFRPNRPLNKPPRI
ncbi:unnamed protein product [Leptosia nina]|uniref:Proline-rich extensin-like protein EPR1 n=1 Tax=Leptosia nina TaxID=320188 RepID=A0AAV1K3A1_9NEOP